ncbi:DUF5671 domain-containing protein [Microbacterium deminutum]|uniref:DUF5671 domain-containing protein n=1 Tax=Microbacterium deminutum TaxID=344164 RepID=A0ABP5CSF3_9MICO
MTADSTRRAGGAGTVVRRIILFTILYALVVVAAIGLSGLIERAIGTDRTIAGDDAGLARSLAFTLIGVPLAAGLWWWQRRRLADPAERASLVWALYVTAMSLTSLIVATVSLASAAGAGIDGEWRPGELSAAIVWSGIWLWHRQMRRSPATAPARLVALPVELAAFYGLVIGAVGAVDALASLISEALSDVTVLLMASQHWAVPVLQALVWFAIGALVWWWHWFRERARDAPGKFAAVLIVIVVGLAAATTLLSVGTLLYVVLRLLFDSAPVAEVLAPLDTSCAAALVGAIVWVYHAEVIARRPETTRSAGRLVVSGVALIGAASGFGVVVNALLATLGPTLVDENPRALLLGGISALVVGGPAWWLAWRPDRAATDAADPARRVYLVAVFGASAIVALVTLLIIGYRVFEFALGVAGGGGLLEHIRAPLGLLSATAIVFGYHFTIWRHDRARAPRTARREIGRVILVTAGDAAPQAAAIRAATGASVTVWSAADAEALLAERDIPALLESLHALSAARVLVVAEPGGGARVTPLAD